MNDVKLTNVPESIAVIGMSGRFPKARSIDEFWRNLRDGVECISLLTAEELTAAGGDPGWLQDPGFVNAGGVLEDMDMFDASFFGFSARDAEIMDPQHRVFLECAVHCLDDAGYNPETYPGLIGVFAGESMSSYVFDLYANGEAVGRLDDFQIGVGNEKDHLATQVSYKLDLRGPSMAVQTACSTSLVAVSMACQSLLSYQCDMALAGGAAADVLTSRGYQYHPGGILSPDGHCRVFDTAANGTVVGNGVGIVALKRLSEAIAARDRIRAVIRGFALNNDGSQKVGYTAPSVEGQAQVIAMAMAVARVEPGTIGYIEAHGTGTELGDPIEIAALRQVFDQHTKRKQFCMIGSVKSNIGHLDAAAGIASLIKTILALEHEAVPPSLHFTRANPKADFENSPFYVPTKLTEWKRGRNVRRAGVSCFGIGGTNAHVVVEEAPTLARSHESRPCCVLKLSARSSVALDAMTDNLAGYLAEHPDASLTDVAYTLEVGRKRFKHRRAVVCHGMTPDEARRALAERDPQTVFAATCEAKARPVFFMLPGQGTQDVDMALAVYRSQPAFHEQLDRCAEILQPHLGLDLRDLLYPTADRHEEAAHALGRTMFTQPALFAIEYALAKLWMSWGIRPSAMIGHSIGEYVAACLAGVFSLEDALALVASRGQLMEEMPPGAMLAVALRESDARHYLDEGVSLAAVNGPSACVLSGPREAVEWLARHLDDSGIRHQRLHTSRAFHSGMMDPVVGPFVRRVQSVRLQAPRIPFQSNVTGDWITPEAAVEPDYWGTQLRQTVRFADGLSQLSRDGAGVFLEVGPRQTLSSLARQQTSDTRRAVLPSLSAGGEAHADVNALLGAWAKLWLYGVEGSDGFYPEDQRRRIPLPGYPFERQRYRIEPVERHESRGDWDESSANRDIARWFYYPCWKPALPLDSKQEQQDDTRKRWLILGGNGLGSQLARALRQRGEDVISAVMGEQFASLGPGAYSLRPHARADYEALLQEEMPRGLPDVIVHMWSVTATNDEQSDDEDFGRHQELGFHSVVRLVQALENHYAASPIRITVVSSQTEGVNGVERLCPAKATVLGACRVIPQEYPNLRCQLVDVDPSESGLEIGSALAGNLITELMAAPFEPVVAWRHGRRWVQAFESVRLEPAGETTPRLRPGGVYLITGGLGRIGLVLAGFLARHARAKLVLTGRSEFPERREWQRWLKGSSKEKIGKGIRKLLELEKLGAEVFIAKADVADRNEMRRVLAEAEGRFGPIHGVIHGAGDTEAIAPVTQTGIEAAAEQFRAKAIGLMVLDELLRGRELDFVLLLSSLASVLGGLGLAAYAAANIFLDTFASERNRQGAVPWISVNWDAWQFPTAEDSEIADDSILPDEGEEAFRRILERAPHQVVVSVSDLESLLDQWIRIDRRDQSARPTAQGLAPQHARPDLTVTYAPPRSEAETTLVEIWQELLGVIPVGIFDNFFDLGGHSLLAIQLISRIREVFRTECSVHRVFEAPTIAELALGIAAEPGRTDEARTAQILDLVERLSDTDIAALLAGDGSAPSAKMS